MQSSTLLAIETSGRYGSAALVELEFGSTEPAKFSQHELPRDMRSAQTLAPVIEALLSEAGLRANEIGAVAVAVGPGSFTGLRVGVTTAKTIAYATGAKLLAVGTIDALTLPHRAEGRRVWGALDAQRGELFAAPYGAGATSGVRRITRADFCERLESGDVVVGPVAESLAASCDCDVEWITEEPSAESVARLGVAKLVAGDSVDPFQLVPEYYRVSAAEENHEARG